MTTFPKILKRWSPSPSRLFRVEAMEIQFSNGEKREYERLKGSKPAVIAVPMLDEDRFIVVREFAAGTEDYQLALPKGRVDGTESFAHAADRELREEAGFGSRRQTLLKQMLQSPNYMEHATQIVLLQDLYEATAEGDEPEPLGVEVFRFSALSELLERSDFSEARSIAALFLAQQYLAG